jgi:tetratricopeptide (TPR) repeat protein
MAKKTLMTMIALALLATFSPAASNPWGDLKKIYFYDTSGNLSEVRNNLDRLDAQTLPPAEKIELMKKLAELGDRYFQKGDYPMAGLFYRKALAISPQDAWPIYNKLEKISRRQGSIFWNLNTVWRQFRLVIRDFSGTFLLLNSLLDVLLFSGFLLLYLVTAVMFIKYFKQASHDFIFAGNLRFSIQKLLLMLLLLLWPLFFTGGWGFYPFLVCGFLWNYFNHDNRTNIKRIMGILLILAFLHSIGQYLEKSLQTPRFQTIKKIYAEELFPESTTNRFDNEMKVMQAYSYFHRNRTDTAIDILLATGDSYNSTLKFNLLGNIYYEKGDIPQSIQYYRQSLSLDNQNQVTLKNFTVALLKNNDPELFQLYGKSYPQLKNFKDTFTSLQKSRLPQKILWKRLLNFSWENFHVWNFLEIVLIEFLKFPVLLAILIMAAYVSLLKRFFPTLGLSTLCSKCGKIIKKMPIEQAPSHALCDGCYQLFLIKDPIFLEAKILKEKEIGRQSRFKHSLILLITLFVPGFVLNFKDKGKAFLFLFLLFFTIFGFSLFASLSFKSVFGVIPMFLNMIGIVAILLYLAINAYSLKGDHNGF